MKQRSASIGQSDLADALKAAISIEQQRIEKLSQSDLDVVAGGLTYTTTTIGTTTPIIIGTGSGTGTMGMVPPPPTGGSSSSL